MKAFKIRVTENSDFPIAIITFDLEGEKINKITMEAGEEFERIVKDLSKTPQIKGMILVSAKPDIFIAGADINEILSIRSTQEGMTKSSEAQRLPTLIESLPFPTVAAVHGACLGGGCELILGFSYRLATDHPKTQIGLPEVSLGILPGMGGCVRLPKLIGLQGALDMILGAKIWPAKKCLKTGLVHEMVPQELLLDRAIEVLEKALWKKKKETSFFSLTFLLEKNRLGRHMIYKKAKDMILNRTRGHYPAPLKALDVIYECLDRGLTDSLKIEAEGFGQLAETAVSKNLIGLFFQREAAKKQTGVADSSLQPKKINSAAVIGAGAMGAGIAQLLSYKDISVRLKDVNEEAIAKGLKYSRKLYQELVDRRQMTPRELEQKMSWIGPTT
ncbi:MAG: enoyl-CoA hydratase/isomerase family protein, partial [Deltaproteobacteria bacterium]|nr:enoyl-CoA hydratase/isomerase family protein [Deltaproteobacteria bacterium]